MAPTCQYCEGSLEVNQADAIQSVVDAMDIPRTCSSCLTEKAEKAWKQYEDKFINDSLESYKKELTFANDRLHIASNDKDVAERNLRDAAVHTKNELAKMKTDFLQAVKKNFGEWTPIKGR